MSSNDNGATKFARHVREVKEGGICYALNAQERRSKMFDQNPSSSLSSKTISRLIFKGPWRARDVFVLTK